MPKKSITTGYSANGLPSARIDGGPRNLVIFEGLNFNHAPLSGMQLKISLSSYQSFTPFYTIYYLGRKPGLPAGYTIKNMSDDYAVMIKNELAAPVDVIGLSTGGTIAQQFAADNPQLVRRLVLASTGYCLSRTGAAAQRRVSYLVKKGKYRAAGAVMAGALSSGAIRPLFTVFSWVMGKSMFASAAGPSDGLVEIEAEDRFNFLDRLREIKAPTLVIGGEKDMFYPICETGDKIPSAQVIIYTNSGHLATMKRGYYRDILAFLTS